MTQKILVVTAGQGPAASLSPLRLRDLIEALDAKSGVVCLPQHPSPEYQSPVKATELEELIRHRK